MWYLTRAVADMLMSLLPLAARLAVSDTNHILKLMQAF
jgi:hypothetical protein